MKSEMESMKVNDVWILVDPLEGVKPIECKWVFKRKRGANGKVETYKACLVAKAYRQRYGIDYDDVFSCGNAQIHSDYACDSCPSGL